MVRAPGEDDAVHRAPAGPPGRQPVPLPGRVRARLRQHRPRPDARQPRGPGPPVPAAVQGGDRAARPAAAAGGGRRGRGRARGADAPGPDPQDGVAGEEPPQQAALHPAGPGGVGRVRLRPAVPRVRVRLQHPAPAQPGGARRRLHGGRERPGPGLRVPPDAYGRREDHSRGAPPCPDARRRQDAGHPGRPPGAPADEPGGDAREVLRDRAQVGLHLRFRPLPGRDEPALPQAAEGEAEPRGSVLPPHRGEVLRAQDRRADAHLGPESIQLQEGPGDGGLGPQPD
mmetsp:Transcript_8185/g.20076  ORF Transcript_8185/g.20076 Transcript_8185/m.20076 type:complete len:285 (-) Transcript_8185:226-1080(-)